MNYYNGNKQLNRYSHNSNNKTKNVNEDSNGNSLGNNDMLDNLIKISGNQEVYKELKDETNKIKNLLSQSKEKLSNINLYEKKKADIDIYQWNNLFNQSIPITSYVSSSKLIEIENNKKEENKSELKKNKENMKNEKHPIALVDLTEEEIKRYLPPPPIGIPPASVIRFQKMPFKGDSNDAFYFSNDFNDYYKMDFKEFIKRMPILKAKKRCKSAKLSQQIKKARKKTIEEEQKREKIRKQMSNILNDLYIEKQYLSLSNNTKNIEPLMNSIHAQIYGDEDDELGKISKIYNKNENMQESEKNENNQFTIDQRRYHRNVFKRKTFKKNRAKSARRLYLPRYDENDPDIAIFKRIELLENIIDEGDNQDLIDEREEEEKSIINCEGESKKEENRNKKNEQNNINNNNNNNINEEDLNKKKNINYNSIQNEKTKKTRAVSAKREYSKRPLTANTKNSKKFPRSMSAHVMRPIQKENECNVHKVYLSSKKKLQTHNAFRKYKGQRNKLSDFDDNRRGGGYSSSQISTYEEGNNSTYENQNLGRLRFPFKTNHQLQNKMYLKINRRLKERQYEKDKQNLEEFSKLIRLDDVLLSDDLIKEKIEKDFNNINSNNNGLLYIDKNKLFNRPLSPYQKNNEQKATKFNTKNNYNKPMTPKLLRYNKSNNFRAISKKSSNENSKIELTTVLNNRNEYFLNNNNDKVTLVYFNNMIETKPQKLSEMKPIIKNDGIIMAPNYFNRGKPQFINYPQNYNHSKSLRRVQSGRFLSSSTKLRDNNANSIDNNNGMDRRRIISAKLEN